MGSVVDALIPFCGGVYCLLVGFRVLGKKPGEDAKFDAWDTEVRHRAEGLRRDLDWFGRILSDRMNHLRGALCLASLAP